MNIETKYTPDQIAEVNHFLGLPATPSVDTIIAEARRLYDACTEIHDCLYGKGQPRRSMRDVVRRIGEMRANDRPRLTPTPAQIGQAIDQWQAARAASDRAYALQAMPPAGIEREEIEILIRHYVAEEKRLTEAAMETLNR